MGRSRTREFNRSNEVIDFDRAREERRKARKSKAAGVRRAQESAPSQRKAAKHKRRIFIYVAVIILIVAAVAVSATEIISLEKEKHQLMAEQAELTNQLESAKEELENADDPEYIEQQVREKLNMVYPGEIIYISPDEEHKIDDEDK